MIDGHDERFLVEHNTFGEVCNLYTDEGHRVNVALPSRAGLAIVSPHDFEEGETFTGCTVQTLKCRRCGMESFAWSKEPAPGQEETLAYICDEVCKYREGRTQEELDAICAKCKVDRWAGAPPTPTPRDVRNPQGLLKEVDDYVNGRDSTLSPGEPGAERDTFIHAHPDIQRDRMTRKVYALGLALAEERPENDCKVYLNIFNMARELDKALDGATGYPATVLRGALHDRLRELAEMYTSNYAVQQFKEGMQK